MRLITWKKPAIISLKHSVRHAEDAAQLLYSTVCTGTSGVSSTSLAIHCAGLHPTQSGQDQSVEDPMDSFIYPAAAMPSWNVLPADITVVTSYCARTATWPCRAGRMHIPHVGTLSHLAAAGLRQGFPLRWISGCEAGSDKGV